MAKKSAKKANPVDSGKKRFELPKAALKALFEAYPHIQTSVSELFELTLDRTGTRAVSPEGFVAVEEAFEVGSWSLEDQERTVAAFCNSQEPNPEQLAQWVRAHDNRDVQGVLDCINTVPPEHIRIIRRMARRGSQKLVFEASFGLTQTTVVLKKPLFEQVAQRESIAHPLTVDHPNIIKTHVLHNSDGEPFFVEDMLDQVLSDTEPFRGVNDIALLLYDIANALEEIHRRGRVHGDVKPDNIGCHDGRFVLLDFGICRPQADFSVDATGTGSLRTRAPEILVAEGTSTLPSDVWALGATAAKFCCRRFPLIEPGERPPRISHPEDRRKYESKLAERVRREYEQCIDTTISKCEDDRLCGILHAMLTRDPAQRPSASEVAKQVRSGLPGRFEPVPSGMPVEEEGRAVLALWPDRDSFCAIPERERAVKERNVRDLIKLLQTEDEHAELRVRLESLITDKGA